MSREDDARWKSVGQRFVSSLGVLKKGTLYFFCFNSNIVVNSTHQLNVIWMFDSFILNLFRTICFKHRNVCTKQMAENKWNQSDYNLIPCHLGLETVEVTSFEETAKIVALRRSSSKQTKRISTTNIRHSSQIQCRCNSAKEPGIIKIGFAGLILDIADQFACIFLQDQFKESGSRLEAK